MIKPTVGRKVWFYPRYDSRDNGLCIVGGREHSADIVSVHNDRLINVAVFDANGKLFQKTSVTLVQEGDQLPDSDHCRWMPYQIGQAKSQPEPAKTAA